uniref:CSON002637 protein n=1 Tax=Culicoides sonorensis TaxID=179676 RepID=A0A336MQM9_CULSO
MSNVTNNFIKLEWLNATPNGMIIQSGTFNNINTNFSNYNGIYINDSDPTTRKINDSLEDSPGLNGSIALLTVIPITVIYVIIFISGVLGNVITCVVISRNRSMHTATNYYLFSLAISDLLVLIAGLPVETYLTWKGNMYPFSQAVCVIQSWVCEVSANASVLTITAFTIERYVAICKPFLSHTMSKLSRAVKFILGIWALAVCLAIPAAMELGIYERGSQRSCTVLDSKSAAKTFTISVVLIFIFPMIVITILYILIGLQLRRSKIVSRGGPSGSSVRLRVNYLKHRVFKKPLSQRTIVQVDLQNDMLYNDVNSGGSHYSVGAVVAQNNSIALPSATPVKNNNCVGEQAPLSPEDGRINFSNRATNHGTRHVVNMLVAVVVAFFFCWGLYHSQRLYAVYYSAYGMHLDSKFGEKLYNTLTWISGIFYYFSTCINPFLYNIMSHKFRTAFKDTIAKYFYHGDEQQIQQRYWYCPSQRSNSFHSQSLNTCSSVISTNHCHSQPSNQLRYKELDLMKLKRPLVVSFRKIPYDTTFSHTSSFESSSSHMAEYEQRERFHIVDPPRFSINETINPIYSCFNERDNGNVINRIDYSSDYNTHKSNHKIISWLDYYSKFNRREKIDSDSLTRLGIYNSTSNGYLTSKKLHLSQKKIYNSPYNSPEMTYDSKRLEENLNMILKQLVFKNETFNCQQNGKTKHRNNEQVRTKTINSISKSKSVPCFLNNNI